MKKQKMNLIFSEQQIRERVRAVAEQICCDYTDDKPILAVCVLRGAIMFYTDLVKEMQGKDVMFDFISLSSYADATASSGTVKMINGLRESVEGKHLLIVEDIIDSGYTIQYIRKTFSDMNPLDLKVVCLMDKPMRRKVDASADYTVFTLQNDAFIVGYGLDSNQLYRNLNGIYEIVE